MREVAETGVFVPLDGDHRGADGEQSSQYLPCDFDQCHWIHRFPSAQETHRSKAVEEQTERGGAIVDSNSMKKSHYQYYII